MVYDGFFIFVFMFNFIIKDGVYICDGMDLKWQMVYVVLVLQVFYLFGMYNIGYQYFVVLGEYIGFLQGVYFKLIYGLIKIILIFVVMYVVGLGIEFYYVYKKGYGIEEGFFVFGVLILFIMLLDILLWILVVFVVFVVWIGKEVFGGMGMNIFNIVLLVCVFVFFVYLIYILGDEVWIVGIEKVVEGGYFGQAYGVVYGFFDNIFVSFGFVIFGVGGLVVVDGYMGVMLLVIVFKEGWDVVIQIYMIG